MVICCYTPADLGKSLRRSFIVTCLATIALFCGIIPEFSWQTARIKFNSTAYTQDITEEQLRRYARAVLSIETRRQQAYREISRVLGGTPPPIACDRRETFNDLPANAQKIAVDYCNNSRRIVIDSGLTSAQFNNITARLRSDNNLKKRIQNLMIQIQRENKSKKIGNFDSSPIAFDKMKLVA